MKQKLTELEEKLTNIVGDFNTSLLVIISRQIENQQEYGRTEQQHQPTGSLKFKEHSTHQHQNIHFFFKST